MSPIISEEKMVDIVPERIREIAQKRNVTQKHLAESVYTSYRNFSRQISSGKIQAKWLVTICKELNTGKSYFTGESDRPPRYSSKVYDPVEQKKAIERFMYYSGMPISPSRLKELDTTTLHLIGLAVSWAIDCPKEFCDWFNNQE